MMRSLCLALALAFAPHAAVCEEIVGPAIAIDSEGLVMGDRSIRVCGIDGPEPGDVGFDEALAAMRSLTQHQDVRCLVVGSGTVCDGLSESTSYHRVIAQCFVGDLDIGAEMVRLGHACAWPKFSGDHYTALGCVTDRP